jgi:uncharacterized membrane protein YbaN (DUF454 family)
MKRESHRIEDLPAKLAACVLLLVCLALGLAGLVLPIIPGLLFLAFAALIASRHFPATDSWLRRNRTLGRHLDSVDAFADLNLTGKLQLGAWMAAKMLLDGAALVGALAAKLANAAWGKRPRYR